MNKIYVCLLGLVLILVICEAVEQNNCPGDFRAVGCYKDSRTNRALSKLIIYERDKKGIWQDYDNYLLGLICRCAKKAKDDGYRVFAVQYWAECWAGNDFRFLNYKTSKTGCYNGTFDSCARDGPVRRCTGKKKTNFVYVMTTAIKTPAPTPLTNVPTSALTKPPTTAPPKYICGQPLDIAFVVDASGSIGHRSFQLVKAFLQDMTHQFNVSLNGTHFACLHYDHKVHRDFGFNDTQFFNQSNLDFKLGNMTYPSGATVTQFALRAAISIFKVQSGARVNNTAYPRVLVVFTDGRTYGGKTKLYEPVEKLKTSSQANIVAIGIGNQIDEEELKIMGGENHYVLVPTFEDLANSMSKVMSRLCYWSKLA